MTKDLIDFPCSTLWLGFYAERGLRPVTPLPSLVTKKPIELHAESEAEWYMARPWIPPPEKVQWAITAITKKGLTVQQRAQPTKPLRQPAPKKVMPDVGDISRF